MVFVATDVYDPRTFLSGIPFDEFTRRRREAPVSWCEERAFDQWPAGPGFWGVFRHADITTVNRNPEVFSSSAGATQVRDVGPEDLPFVQQMMLNMDPPDHTRLRRVMSRSFTPRAVQRLSESIESRARRLVDEVSALGRCDFVKGVSADLPVATLAEIMGVPHDDRHLLYSWANRVIGYQDDDYAESAKTSGDQPPPNPRSRAALSDMYDYADALAATKIANPGDDLLSVLLQHDTDGESLTVEQYQNMFFLLSVAGNETVRNGLPGALLTLIEHPEAMAELRSDRSLMATAVDELLRFTPPVVHFRRTAVRDTELGGQAIGVGEKVVVFYASGNRDEDAFDDPDQLRLDRDPNPHLSFGAGAHHCLGAHLARMQMSAMLNAVLDRWDDIALETQPVRLTSSFQAGFKSMPITFRSQP
ncbi:MAG: cytochrome P450 [Acidimicrobiales bacterium]